MIISLDVFLYIYYGFLFVWGLLFLAVTYHMLKFGLKNFLTFFITFIFIAVAVLLLYVSNIYIDQIDWSQTVTIFGGSSKPNPIF